MMQNPNHNNNTPMSSFINLDDEAEKEKHGFGGKVDSNNNNGDNDNTNGDINNNAVVVGGGIVGCSTPLRSNVVRQQQLLQEPSSLRSTEILSPIHKQKSQPTSNVIQSVQQPGVPTNQQQQASHPTTTLPTNTLSSSQPQQPPPTAPPTKNVTRKGRFNIVIQTTGSSPPRSHSRQKLPSDATTTSTHSKIPTSPQVPVTKGKFTVSAVTTTTNDDAKSNGDTASVGTIGEMSVNSAPPPPNGIVKGKFTVSAATTTPATGATMPTPHVIAGDEPPQQQSSQQPPDSSVSSGNSNTHPVANDGSITKGKFTVRAVSSTSHGSINSQLTTNSNAATHPEKQPTDPPPTDAPPPPPNVVKGKFTISAVAPLPPTEPPPAPLPSVIVGPPPPIPESTSPPHDTLVSDQPIPIPSHPIQRTPSRETLTTKKKGRFVLIQAEIPHEGPPPLPTGGVSAAVAILPTNEAIVADRPAPPVVIAQTIPATIDEGGEECVGGLLRCWEGMGREVREVEKVVRGLKEALRLLHDKNRELEQRNHDLEKKYVEEKRHRQAVEKKLKILTKSCRERDAAAAAAATTAATAVAPSNNTSHVGGTNNGGTSLHSSGGNASTASHSHSNSNKTSESNLPRHVRSQSDLGAMAAAAAAPATTTTAAQTLISNRGRSSSTNKLSDSDYNYYHCANDQDNVTPLTAVSTKHDTTPSTTTANDDAVAAPKQSSAEQFPPLPQLPFSGGSTDHLPLHEDVPYNPTTASGTNGPLTDSPPAQHQQHHHQPPPKQQQQQPNNTTPPTHHKNSESNSSYTITTPCNSCTSSTASHGTHSHSSSPSTGPPPTHNNAPSHPSSHRPPTRVQRSQSFTTTNPSKTTPPTVPCHIPSSSSYTCPSTAPTTVTHTYFDPLQSHSADSRTYSSDSDDSPSPDSSSPNNNDLLTLISYPLPPQRATSPPPVLPATLVMTNDWSTTTMPLPPGCLNQMGTTIMQGTWHQQQPPPMMQQGGVGNGGVYRTIPRQFLMVPQGGAAPSCYQPPCFQQPQQGVSMPYPQGGVSQSLGATLQQQQQGRQQPSTGGMDPFEEIANRPGAKWQ